MQHIKGYLTNLGRGVIAALAFFILVPIVSMIAGIAILVISLIGQNNEDMLEDVRDIKVTIGEEK